MRLWLFLPFLSLVLQAQAEFPGKAEDEALLRQLKEHAWPRAYFEQDVAALSAILAEEFVRVDAAGQWATKAEELARVEANKPGYDSLVFTIKRLDIFENGTAIVAGEGLLTGGSAGEHGMSYQSTNVLIKRDGRWQAIASHVSGVRSLAAPQ
jgi:ketosteroid isomerase-like protein